MTIICVGRGSVGLTVSPATSRITGFGETSVATGGLWGPLRLGDRQEGRLGYDSG